MKLRKNLFAASITTALIGLTGCGATSQDQGSGTTTGNISGLAVDGYLAGATVFADTNNNNILESWEPRALTDQDGYFSYNPKTGKNYCTSTVATDKNYCLATPVGYDNVTLRISGGYDLTTMEKFNGTMSLHVNIASAEKDFTTPQVTNPITALLAPLTDTQKTNLLAAEGITGYETKDILDSTATGITDEAMQRKLLDIALKAQKVADLIANQINLKFDQAHLADSTVAATKGLFGEQSGFAPNGTALIFEAIAKQISNVVGGDGVGVTTIMGSQTDMEQVVSDAWDEFGAAVDDYNNRLLANAPDGTTLDTLQDKLLKPTTKDTTGIAAGAKTLAGVADTLFNTNSLTAPFDTDIASRIKALDVVTYLMRDGQSTAAGTPAENAITLCSDATYLNNLRSDKVDVAGLKDKFKNETSALTASAADYSARQGFAGSGGLLDQAKQAGSSNTLGFTGVDGAAINTEGMVNNALNVKDGNNSTAISFLPPDGETASTVDPATPSGKLEITGAILDQILGSSTSGSSGSTTETSTSSLTGTWQQLDPYTMLMNVDIAGVSQPVIVKPTLDSQGKQVYYLNVGGEQKVWTP